ncbi:hypothetical protein [Alkalitalea saponilacus]|uniref:Uncharacterized protein n=1 Tax=Alkalitalea saponilacus TaxID=889453 RepID=A0A1T5H1X4_9BACT|nr:hypothetical protein [Alkalitalea saponilacus]ASB50932.1 hypothetical protein CDL62_18160 [Alkalitalea saponilacus]SKC14530.1 hypothetical protein SAMN03080601_02032 [Alkalitalea saponilacus]
MKTTILSTFFLFLKIAICAQSSIIGDLNRLIDQHKLENRRARAIADDRYSQIDGSPYLNEDFKTGVVVINDTLIFEDIPMRYNIFSDRIEYKNDQDQVLELDTRRINKYDFKIDDLHLSLKEYTDGDLVLFGLLEVLEKGEVTLYRKYHVEMQEATPPKGFQEARPNRFVRRNDKNLISIGDDLPMMINNRRDFNGIIELIDADLDSYLRNNKVRFRSEDSILELVSYINSK